MQLIADILSFNDNQQDLSKQISQTAVDWDAVVIVGSKHLMLPALYCRLKTKGLLKLIPNELSLYLEEIADINRGRNEILLSEAHEITKLFNKENIDHVFIKGMALLAGHVFRDPAERMIGDLDILIAPHQLQEAFEILTKQGYTAMPITSDYQKETFRHLPRQASPDKFGAVELHSEVLLRKHTHLISNEQVLKNKRIINGIATTSIEDSIRISILALQVNDRAHILGFLKFKTIYDCLALDLPTNQSLLDELCHEPHTQSFLHISSCFFKELTPKISSNYSLFLTRYFLFRLNYPKVGAWMYSAVSVTTRNFARLVKFLYIKSFRRHVFKNKILSSQKQH